MTRYQPIIDPARFDRLVVPVRRQVEASVMDQMVELASWKKRAVRAGSDVIMYMDGVNGRHYEARPLRPDDV